MMSSRTCSLWRGYALSVLALAALCWLFPGEGATQQQPGGKKYERDVNKLDKEKGPAPAKEMKIFQLKYVPASDAARTIVEALGRTPGHDLRVSVDPRINSVIAVAAPDDMGQVEALLSKMDVASAGTEPEVRFFHLNQTGPEIYQALERFLPSVNFVVDSNRNLVIVSGDAKTIGRAERLLQQLNMLQPQKPRISDMQVRIVWLASGLTRKESPGPPEDLKEVVAELAKLGVDNPRLVTQAIVTAQLGKQFRVEGLAGLDQPPYRLSISGTVMEGGTGETNRLQISVNATQATVTPGVPVVANHIGRVETEITAPIGHSVVLGMTPTATSTSIFVVQILPKK